MTTRAAALSVLLVEDSRADACLVREELRQAGEAIDVTEVSTLAGALAHLERSAVDVVILDLDLPDSTGPETFQLVADRVGAIPVVVLTGRDDRRVADELVDLGAQDYITKREALDGALNHAIRFAMTRQRAVERFREDRRRELRARDQFLSHVSHELRTPLTAVHQYVSLVRDGLAGPLTEGQEAHLDVVTRNLRQLRVMIDDLLTVTRLRGGRFALRPRPVPIGDVISQTARSLAVIAADAGVELQVDTDAALPLVLADPDRVIEVVLNLVENAVKFTPPGGRTTVRATAAPAGTEVVVSVEDDGVGIPDGDRERVFDPFFQVSGSDDGARLGLGLGLHIASEIVVRHGGRMWIDGGPDGGTIVSFTLPVAPDTPLMTELGGAP